MVMNDLVLDVNRRSENLKHALDDLDRSRDACAEAARSGEQHLHTRSIPAHRLLVCYADRMRPFTARRSARLRGRGGLLIVVVLLLLAASVTVARSHAEETSAGPVFQPPPPAADGPPANPGSGRTVEVSSEEVVRGDPNKPNVALVVNVGAGSEPALSMLDTLREKGVRTT